MSRTTSTLITESGEPAFDIGSFSVLARDLEGRFGYRLSLSWLTYEQNSVRIDSLRIDFGGRDNRLIVKPDVFGHVCLSGIINVDCLGKFLFGLDPIFMQPIVKCSLDFLLSFFDKVSKIPYLVFVFE